MTTEKWTFLFDRCLTTIGTTPDAKAQTKAKLRPRKVCQKSAELSCDSPVCPVPFVKFNRLVVAFACFGPKRKVGCEMRKMPEMFRSMLTMCAKLNFSVRNTRAKMAVMMTFECMSEMASEA